MAESFHTIADQETLEKVISIALKDKSAPHSAKDALDPAFESLLSQVVRYATGEDRYWNQPESLLARVMDAWSAAEGRVPGEPTVSLRLHKSENWRDSRLVLDVIADDMPFIVDSVTAALTDAGKTAHFFANAVVNVSRDKSGKRTTDGKGVEIAESIIHAELDPPVDDGEIEILELELQAVLADTALAVADFGPMRDRLAAGINQLERYHPRSHNDDDLNESIAFLKKLWDNKFTFLGVRRYNYALEDGEPNFVRDQKSDLGILRDNARRVLKTTWSNEGELSPAVTEFMQSDEPLIITKANARSTVHRRVHMDYVGLKIYGEDGSVIGEDRFVGLLTSDMYNRPASDIPILRKKIQKVIEGAGFRPGGHNAKALVHILETFPRDEMFQADIETLTETALGILRLYKRPRTKVFLRRDRFDRFISALVYIPRDRFSSNVREGIGDIMADAYDGYIAAFSTQFGDASLVRVHYIIGIAPGAPEGPGITELVRRIREVTRTWGDNLLDALREANEGATPHGLFQRYESAFDVGYRERTDTSETLDDIAIIETMTDADVAIRVFRRPSSKDNELNIKLYCPGHGLRLSALIPQLENLGLSVLQESDAQVQFSDHDGAGFIWIHDFYTEEKHGRTIDVSTIKHTVETAFAAILGNRAEDDGFNALVVLAGLDWREVAVLRAGAKYLLQSGFSYSQSYIEETLSLYPEIARNLVACFHAKFNPSGASELKGRTEEIKAIETKIVSLLEDVHSLDQDRIIRRFLNLLTATLRTNFYQRVSGGDPKPYISFKLNSSLIDELPEPKPFREIFVSGPRVDGVHLRFGAIARGGLRWSDRKEDYRTEVLGLVKAQRVKNAVIVPSGSKGGFFPKQLPVAGDRNEIFEEGKAAYREFIRGLLDLTDNIVSGKTVSPESVVCWDEEDPYLVVAADKGTA
ncbi:MAG: NAD-glutamate dehydrogenase, partial [Parvularculaceae bacterium]|nr:NAD-glutamate dehydrogenase [Parvularculaceae bacterium]